MAIVNKFILQGESKQLIEELKKAENAYEQHLQTIKETTTKINENEKAQIQATKNIAKYGKSSQSAQLEAQKEILAGLKLERRELNLSKKELTEKNAIYKKEIASIKQKSKAKDKEVKEWAKGTEKELQAEKELDRAMDNISKKSEIRNDKARVASIQKQLQNEKELKSLKDTLLVYSKAEQVERKYTQLQTESFQAYANGIITKDQYIASTKNLTKAQKEEIQSVNDGTNALVRKLRQMETLVVGFYALKKAYDATLGRGHEFNKLIESETIGLKLLIAQNLANVDAMGRAVTAQEKFNYAQVEAEKAMRNVREINVQTPHTLAETLQIYKLITPQVMKYGGELEDVGKITKNVSVMASAMGIEFQQLLKTVDSLMSGQMNESGLKRAMEQFGISQKEVNKTIEEGGDVVELFIDKLKQVDPASAEIAKTWGGVTAQFINKYDELWSELQKPLFESMKVGIKDATEFMKEHGEQIKWVVGNLDTLAIATTTAYMAYKVYPALYESITSKATIATRATGAYTKATTLMGTAMKSVPLVLFASAVAGIAMELWGAKEASDAMRKSATLTIAELKKMDIARLESNNVLISSAIKKKKIEIAGLASDVRGADGYSIAGVSVLKMSEEELAVAKEKLATAKEEMAELRKQKQVIKEITTEKKVSSKVNDYKKYEDEVAHLKDITDAMNSLNNVKSNSSVVEQKILTDRMKRLADEYIATEKLIEKDKERFKWYTAPKDPNRILANPNLNDKLVEDAKQYNDTKTPREVELNKAIIEQKKEIAKLDKLINDDNNKNEINRSEWIESREILQKSIKNEEAEILELEKKGAESSASRARTEKSRAKELENNIAKQLALEYAIAKQHIKIDILNAQLNGKALTKVEILKKELELLHTKDGLEKSEKNANDHKINILNKELELKRAIRDEEDKLNEYNVSVKQSILDYEAKQTQKKVDAEKLYHELLGDKSYDENLKYWEIRNTLQDGGIDLTIEEIKLLEKQNKLREEYNNMLSQGINTLISDTMNGGSFTDSLQGMLDGMTGMSMDKFSKDLGDKIADGITDGFKIEDFSLTKEDGSLSDLGTEATVAGIHMLGDLLIDDSDRNSNEEAGGAIGEAAGTAIGAYFGGPLGASIGGELGNFLGAEVGGFLFGGDVSYYAQMGENGLESYKHKSGGVLSHSKTTLLEKETLRIQKDLDDAYKFYDDMLSYVAVTSDGVGDLDFGKYDVDRLFNEVLPKDFFEAWISESSIYTEQFDNTLAEIDTSLSSILDRAIDDLNGLDTEALTLRDEAIQERTDELYDEWSTYAERIDMTINEALNDVLGRSKAESIAVDEFNLRNDEEALYNYRADIYNEQELALEADLGLGDVNLDNYNDLLQEMMDNGESPEAINNMTALGEVLISSAQNTDELNNYLAELEQATIDTAEALSESIAQLTEDANTLRQEYSDWYSTKDMTEDEAYSYTLMRSRQDIESLMGELNVDSISAETYTAMFNDAVARGMDEDALDMWDELGTKIQDVTNLEAERIGDIDNFLKDTVDTTMGLYDNFDRTKTDFYNDPTTDNASSYLNYLGDTATSQYDYNFEYARMANTLQDTAEVQSPTYTANGAMVIEDTTTAEKLDELTIKVDELATTSDDNSTEQIAELTSIVDTLKELIDTTVSTAQAQIDATETASYQTAI